MNRPRLALVAAATAILLVAGCGVDPGHSGKADDNKPSNEGAQRQGGVKGAQPAPGSGRTDGNGNGTGADQLREGDAPKSLAPDGGNLSTFALDIDTASYDYARRALSDGRLPDPGQVRPEEFVNAFDQDYTPPAGEGIAVHADGSRLPAWQQGGDDTRLLRIGLQTRPERFGERADANLTFVVDVSGSMREPGRLDLVQDALNTLIDQLRMSDSVAIVAYSGRAHVIRPMTPAWEKGDLHRAVDELTPDSNTNLEAGLVTGYEVARAGFRQGAANRVILLSDGLANAGSTDHEAILSRVRENAGKDIPLLCVGVGRQYGDQLMEQLADHGDGFAVYVSQRAQARRLFVDRLPGTLEVAARDAKAQVAFDPGNVAGYQLLGYEDRAVPNRDFRNNAADGGEVGPGHSVTALYLVTLRPDAYGTVATATARWLSPRTGAAAESTAVVGVADLSSAFTTASPRLRLDYVAGVFAAKLRTGWSPGTVAGSLDWLASEADQLAVETEDRDASTLAGMIRRAGSLT
ncbi:MAG TPA: von Willebrand factor type A domain-containing protein [Actinopolymorphaceae bacterium]|nr:von Willebrand factor type A domain-containing protein [Actinopolymorphaceae bacterium]